MKVLLIIDLLKNMADSSSLRSQCFNLRKVNYMKKIFLYIFVITLLKLNFIAYAYGWQNNGTGWYYGLNEDDSYYYDDGWHWIDGNEDGIYECYYFLPNGYICKNKCETTPDGFNVNSLGMWTYNGVVQRQYKLNENNNKYLISGLSKDAADMIYKTKKENAVYGEKIIDLNPHNGYCRITYDNGLMASYSVPKSAYTSEQWYFEEFDPHAIDDEITTSIQSNNKADIIMGLNNKYENQKELMTRIRELGYKNVLWEDGIIYIGNYIVSLDSDTTYVFVKIPAYIRE